jgi:hypothetical protein
MFSLSKTQHFVCYNRYGDCSQKPRVLAGDVLNDEEKLREVAASIDVERVTTLEKSGERIGEIVRGLQADGQTAAGPALLLAGTIASRCGKADVLFCSDGIANVGVGAVDDSSSSSSSSSSPSPSTGGGLLKQRKHQRATSKFYNNIGVAMKTAGVTISVVSIEGDSDIENLSRVASLSGGTVTQVKPLEVQRQFRALVDKPKLASNVQLQIRVSKNLLLLDSKLDTSSVIDIDVGNVNCDSDCK